jgi:hypothetical protein
MARQRSKSYFARIALSASKSILLVVFASSLSFLHIMTRTTRQATAANAGGESLPPNQAAPPPDPAPAPILAPKRKKSNRGRGRGRGAAHVGRTRAQIVPQPLEEVGEPQLEGETDDVMENGNLGATIANPGTSQEGLDTLVDLTRYL